MTKSMFVIISFCLIVSLNTGHIDGVMCYIFFQALGKHLLFILTLHIFYSDIIKLFFIKVLNIDKISKQSLTLSEKIIS
jgi:hypothetical protein